MNYRKAYMRIISHAKSEQQKGLRVKGNGEYYERHHILPKSLFPNWIKRKTNLVLLTAREHFFCHQLLIKIYDVPEMTTALWFMYTNGRYGKVSSKEYENLKIKLSNNMKGHKRNLGRVHNEASRLRYREGRKRYLKERGEYHLFTNGKVTVQAKKCPEGFKPGRLLKDRDDFCRKAKESHIGLRWWTNGIQNIQSRERPGVDFKPGRTCVISKDQAAQISLKLKKLNAEKPMTWYNNGIRNFRIRKGDVVPSGLTKGKLPNSRSNNIRNG